MDTVKKTTILIALMVVVGAVVALNAGIADARPVRCVDVCLSSPCFEAPRCPANDHHCKDSWGVTTTCCAYCPD